MATLPIRYPQLGERFSKLMDSRGWTTTQLAAVAGPEGGGVTFATIARIRKGQTRPRAALLARLAAILDVTEEEIIGDDQPLSRKRGQSKTGLGGDVSLARPNSLEAKMARIQEIRRQLEAADRLKLELARLVDEVAAELEILKNIAISSP